MTTLEFHKRDKRPEIKIQGTQWKWREEKVRPKLRINPFDKWKRMPLDKVKKK